MGPSTRTAASGERDPSSSRFVRFVASEYGPLTSILSASGEHGPCVRDLSDL